MGSRISRRAIAAAGAATFLVAAPAAAAAPLTLPTLAVGDDWAAVLAATPQVQLAPGATYTLTAPVDLPDGCLIVGNGATVTVPDDRSAALSIRGRRDVTMSGVRFLGRAASPVGTAPQFEHVGLRITRSTAVRILDCDFTNWRGAGIAVTGSVQDDYLSYRVKLRGNSFHQCYFGVSLADRSEYSQLTANSFTSCRLAIWNSSGNWAVNDNLVSGCYGAYYSIGQSSPYGTLTSDNWGHGSVTGNTMNHANTPIRWGAGLPFRIGTADRDPGPGVVVERVLPPTFTGNTLWYTDIRAVDLLGTRWLLSGCTLSNLAVNCTGSTPVHLAGTQASSAATLPRLVGNVRDLLPL